MLKIEKPLGKGDRVFRVRSAEAAFHDVAGEPRIPLSIRVKMHIGHPLELALATPDPWDAARKVEIFVARQSAPIEPARTKAVSAEEVIEHIDRLGSTPFKLDHIEVELDEGVGIGFSALHKIRAQACEQLEEALLARYHERVLEKAPSRVFAPRIRKGSCKVAVLATNQLVPALQNVLEQISSMCLYIITVAVKPSCGPALANGRAGGLS